MIVVFVTFKQNYVVYFYMSGSKLFFSILDLVRILTNPLLPQLVGHSFSQTIALFSSRFLL